MAILVIINIIRVIIEFGAIIFLISEGVGMRKCISWIAPDKQVHTFHPFKFMRLPCITMKSSGNSIK